MAIGSGEGGDQVAPLARAVVGGLFASTFAVVIVLPLVFAWVQEKTSTTSVSLDPEDEESTHYIGGVSNWVAGCLGGWVSWEWVWVFTAEAQGALRKRNETIAKTCVISVLAVNMLVQLHTSHHALSG